MLPSYPKKKVYITIHEVGSSQKALSLTIENLGGRFAAFSAHYSFQLSFPKSSAAVVRRQAVA